MFLKLSYVSCQIVILTIACGDIPFAKKLLESFGKEYELFEKGPKTKSKFETLFRKFHPGFVLLAIFLHRLAISEYVRNKLISYTLMCLAALISLYYFYITFIYIIAYIDNFIVNFKKETNLNAKNLFRSVIFNMPPRKLFVIFMEIIKSFFLFKYLASKSFYKVAVGDADRVAPWRKKEINEQFPPLSKKYEDFIWTEQNVAKILENRVWGRPDNWGMENIEVKKKIKKKKFYVKKKSKKK